MGVGKAIMPYTNTFENAGIGTAYASTFECAGIGLFMNCGSLKTYTNAFENAGIGPEIRRYKSSKLLVKVVLAQIKTSEQGLKSTETYPDAFEKC